MPKLVELNDTYLTQAISKKTAINKDLFVQAIIDEINASKDVNEKLAPIKLLLSERNAIDNNIKKYQENILQWQNPIGNKNSALIKSVTNKDSLLKVDSTKLKQITDTLNIKIKEASVTILHLQEQRRTLSKKINEQVSDSIEDINAIRGLKFVDELFTKNQSNIQSVVKEGIKKWNESIPQVPVQEAVVVSQGLTNFKLPSQTEMIDALATYIAKRAKQEAIVYFLKNWKTRFSDSVVSKFLPATSEKFKQFDDYSTPSFDGSWRYAFSKDINMLPANIIKYVAKDTSRLGIALRDSFFYLSDAEVMAKMVIKKYSFIDIINLSADNRFRTPGLRTFASLMQIFNNEFYDATDSSKYWISSTKFLSEVNNHKESLEIFMQLLANKYKDFPLLTEINVNAMTVDDVARTKSWISSTLIALMHLESSQKSVYVESKDYSINNYWQALSELIEISTGQQMVKSMIKQSKSFAAGLRMTNQLLEVYQLMQNKNYAGGSVTCLELIKPFLKTSPDGSLKFAMKVTAFVTDVMQSKNSDDLAKVIETHALPPASFRLKGQHKGSISLGAYFGPYGGIEIINDDERKPKAVFGLSAPISLDFNFAAFNESYFTLSVVLVDIGAAVSYRISHDNQGLPENVRWSQLFSPGLAGRVGLGNTPLTFSLGGQLNPQLRDFGQQAKNDAFRVYAGLMLDMPLLFAKKGKERKVRPPKVNTKPTDVKKITTENKKINQSKP